MEDRLRLFAKDNNSPKVENKTNISTVKRGIYRKRDIEKLIDSSKIYTTSSINGRRYGIEDFISFGNSSTSIDPGFDFVAEIDKKSGEVVIEFLGISSKYSDVFSKVMNKRVKSGTTWAYKIEEIAKKDSDLYPTYSLTSMDKSEALNMKSYIKLRISVPANSNDWTDILGGLLDIMLLLRSFLGNIYKLVFIEKGNQVFGNSKKRKLFSVNMIPFFIGAAASKMLYIVKQHMKSSVKLDWDSSRKVTYSSNLMQKLVDYCDKKFKDKLIIGQIGAGSYYIDLTNNLSLLKDLKDTKFLKENNIDPTRLRCEMDYWAKGVIEGKDVICYSENDPVPALAHEIGHFLENNDKYLGPIQRASHRGVFSTGFVTFLSILFGLISASPIASTIKLITGTILKFPELVKEFMASYYGLELLRIVGASKSDLEKAEFALKAAFKTYIIFVLDLSTTKI